MSHKNEKWHLYVIECAGFYKIGITGSPYERMKTMRAYNPLPLKCVMYRTIPRRSARLVEGLVHQRLAEFHHTGEWFRASLDDIRAATYDAMLEAQRVERRTLKRERAAEEKAAAQNIVRLWHTDGTAEAAAGQKAKKL